MSTSISAGSAARNRIFNAALFMEATRRNSFTNVLTGPAPKKADKKKIDGKQQTNPGAPVVRITDLSKKAGDEVTVDLYHQLRQKPVMGDSKLAGKGASLTSSQFPLKIDQGRTMVDSGGAMSQQRTAHDLKQLARTLLGPYYTTLEDQLVLIHLAGARGVHNDSDWIVPLEDDADFQKICVNPLTPPTYDRHTYGGDATAVDNLDSADLFTLASVDNMRLILDEMPFPLQPVKFEGDPQADDAPFHVLFVSPRQWHDFWTSTSGNDWRALTANAHQRAAHFKHPVFLGECAMWNGILVRKMKRPVRFIAGTNVSVCTNSASAGTSTQTAGTTIDRAILLGGQALANAYGRSGKKAKGGMHFSMHEEKTDHENVVEHSIAWMNGKAKIRFKGTDGRTNDHGVMVHDTAVSGN
ncbi:N4-gp56 family major capsid protein [Microbulbifer sp. TYP-18]|uniref:N4-gp56 family major capsid protein n=1 Tax=Microbulbifer sp. TYP-18 TaxID=3230024 RepID=UPI0034C6D8D1